MFGVMSLVALLGRADEVGSLRVNSTQSRSSMTVCENLDIKQDRKKKKKEK